ncbi:hypothetical protein ElyMa_003730900 [Elysia marginata]|uniref:Uncharacterized protein n=1 Tax=Elysia marginata TaxID=1093978 RepID=A0AAV4F5W1_9GAST|nr:hypothetical protein ElyMa_003730900 [Elysia marginata]
MADGLTRPLSQSSAVKPTLPMGFITSCVTVVGAQEYNFALRAPHADCVLAGDDAAMRRTPFYLAGTTGCLSDLHQAGTDVWTTEDIAVHIPDILKCAR